VQDHQRRRVYAAGGKRRTPCVRCAHMGVIWRCRKLHCASGAYTADRRSHRDMRLDAHCVCAGVETR
jgi:hypothetical protein